MTETYAQRPAKSSRKSLSALTLVVLVSLALAVAAIPRIERYFMIQNARQDEATLRLVSEVLRGVLAGTEALPVLLAERPILAQVLREPDNSGLVPFANEQLRQTALSLGVSDIYLMDVEGTTVASSNYRLERSFMGRNFAFRPYFTDALAGGVGRFHALGTTSLQRGYYFAAPVLDGTEIAGVVAVKITLDGYEDAWSESISTVIVGDANNVIFMTDRQDWLFHTIGALDESAIEAIASTRQYPIAQLQTLSFEQSGSLDGLEELTISQAGATETFVMQERLIALAGWRIKVLTPTGPARAQALVAFSALALLVLLIGLIVAVLLQRRAELVERLEAQRGQQELLERRVRERTLDLDVANRQLVQEVEDRRTTEQRLRQTQNELVQAGKLAALGQMSAALSHEFNQPLAAVKAYAENAATFLDRGRATEARDNVTRISGMADRMASISKHLRNFARRPQEKIGPIPLLAVIQDAADLMEARLRQAKAQVIRHDFPRSEIWVTGGRVRLQQVLVNLLSNALDAMAQQDEPLIEISYADRDGDEVSIIVRDHGAGLETAALDQAFDPFFTTKEPGKGLGLGLSISYNIIRDFGGRIEATNHPEGGAIFTLTLASTAAPLKEEPGPDLAAE